MIDKKVVLITGSSRGIGRALALAFGKAGYRVAVHCREKREQAEAVVREIEQNGGEAGAFHADVRDLFSVQKMIEDINARWGGPDVLVNNAAVNRDRTILRMSKEEWDEVIDTDVSGAFYVLQACAKVMAKSKDGAIINIASIVGARGSFGNANYAAAKAGLIALTKGAARELGRFNIRVNAVLPGYHATDMGATAPADYVEKIKEESVLGVTTDIQELAEFIVFLSNKKTVSGQLFNWDSRII